MILIINQYRNRLCQDGRWRGFAHFGTDSDCVKVYRSMGHAKRKALKIDGIVIEIPELPEGNVSVDAAGKVIKIVPSTKKPGYETVTHHDLLDFAVCSALSTSAN